MQCFICKPRAVKQVDVDVAALPALSPCVMKVVQVTFGALLCHFLGW